MPRGKNWRGIDCDSSRTKPKSSKIYPGRLAELNNWDSKKGDDSNCNFISGKNESTGWVGFWVA